MKDTQLYQQILGLAKPWRVDGVTLKTADRTIEVEVQCDEQAWTCPECGQRAHLHGREQRAGVGPQVSLEHQRLTYVKVSNLGS